MEGDFNMIAWISGNISTIIVCAVLIAVTALIIIKMIKDKKRGKSCCGCAGCAMKDVCRDGKQKR
jgi:hypothetical protein